MLAQSFNTNQVRINREIFKYLSLIIFLLFFINCQPQTVEKKDYLISKAKNEKATLILFPCFLCDKINTQNEAKFLENIEKEGISTVLLDFNQKLYLNEKDQEKLAEKLNSIFDKNKLSKNNIYIGGFSSGGNVTVIISNYLIKTKNQIQPKGIFIVDSPLDLEELYNNAQNDIKLNKNVDAVEEGKYLINLFEENIGEPKTNIEDYKKKSPYLISQNSIINIEYLTKVKTRFYTEPDLDWQSKNRNRKYENLNAYKLEKTYHALRQLGSKKTEFIKTENRGYRSNGQKHPHSWNIVEKESLVEWILE